MLRKIILSLGTMAIFSAIGLVKAQSRKPNVIFVFSDDERYNSLSMTGDAVTQTPHLDQLAQEGVFFNQAVITSPICGPSRANIFTGQWERMNNIGFTYVSNNTISEEVFANSWLMKLKNAGYSTAFIGKHHTTIGTNDAPLKNDIDFCYYGKGHLGFYPADKHEVFSNLKNETQVEGLFEATEAFLKQDNSTDYFYENINASFKNCVARRDSTKPFCAWINFNLPHASSIGGMGSRATDPSFYSTLYNDQIDAIEFPDNYPVPISLPEEVFATSDLMNYYVTSNKAGLLNTKLQMNRAVHAIDLFMGNLRHLLDSLGEAENTIIIYCSDNGLFLGEHGFGGKTMLYEESVRVPMIVYSPFLANDKRGRIDTSLVVGQDISATILDMCGVEIPETYQGESMLPLMEGEQVDWREDVLLENLFTDQGYPRHEAVRSNQWKYIRYYSRENDRLKYLPEGIPNEIPIYEELFNLKNDPKEQNNLAGKLEYLQILNEHRNKCADMVRAAGGSNNDLNYGENIAPSGTATQSSTANNGVASRAIDGNTNGVFNDNSVTHTTKGLEDAWWQVDLGSDQSIAMIKIFNRTDCCMDRLSEFTVNVTNNNGDITFSKSYSISPNPSLTINIGDIQGQIVKIQKVGTDALSLAEVQVFGVPSKHSITFKLENNLPNVTILINKYYYTSDENGEVSFTLNDNEYNFSCTKFGYETYEGNISVSNDTTLQIQMTETVYHSLQFLVNDFKTNGPISAVSLLINNVVYISDSEGKITLDLKNGEYDYSLSKDGYSDLNGNLTVSNDTIITIGLNSETSAVKLVEYEGIMFFPNPVQSVLNIESRVPIKKIMVYDVSGKLIENLIVGKAICSLNTIDYADGLYVGKIQLIDGKRASCKFSVLKGN